MAAAQEIKEHLQIALQEIGDIKPWYDRKFRNWIFSHPSYPVEYAGESKEEVIKNYPLYLKDFIKERLKSNLSPSLEKKTTGRGGIREGAGRPMGTTKEPKTRIYLPLDIAAWFSHPGAFLEFRQMYIK